MNKKSFLTTFCGCAILLVAISSTFAQELKPIQLPKAQMDGGKPLMQALKDRKSARTFSVEKLPMQTLANMLWAACGINRPDLGQRTAPSAMNRQEIDIYVATVDGLYLYNAKANELEPIVTGDIRALTGRQPFVAEAPVNLVFVTDYSKMGERMGDDQKDFYSAADTGFISENVYLYCASEGLSTVVRATIDKPALAKAMKLRPDQKVILSQTVGYPKK